MRVVTPVSPRVSGYVAQVHVHNNSQVKKGDLLYELDPTPFSNKVQAAQIAFEQAKLSNQQLDAQIAAARANLRTAQFTARNDKVTLDRYQRLSTMQNVSQSIWIRCAPPGRPASSRSARSTPASRIC
nr:secretion protein [Raoultella sp. NCTC 9187]